MENTKNIYQRLNEVMQKVGYVQKENKVQGMQFRFVAHDAVTASLHAPMADAGIIFRHSLGQITKLDEMYLLAMEFEFINKDDLNDKMSIQYIVPVSSNKVEGKPNAQSLGTAISYATKYALLKTFLLETGDEDVELRDHKLEEEAKKAELARAKKEIDAKNKNEQQSPKTVPIIAEKIVYITPDEIAEIQYIVGGNAARMEKILEYYKVEDLNDLTASDTQHLMKNLTKQEKAQ